MDRKEKRGRPVTYKLQDRRRFAELIRKHGASQTREASGRSVSMATLLKIAREFDIELKVGRRSHAA
jgi:hypothetical protein